MTSRLNSIRRILIGMTLCCSLLLTAISSVVSAEQSCSGDCVPVGSWHFKVSLGYGQRSNPVIGQDDIDYYIVPEISYYGKRFFFDSWDLGYTLIDKEQHQFNVILLSAGFEQAFFSEWSLNNVDLSSYTYANPNVEAVSPPYDGGEPTDNPSPEESLDIERLHDRDTAGLSGFEYTYMHQHFEWQTQALQDVTGVHKGQKVRTALTFPFQQNKNFWALTGGLTWQSSRLVDYYYGVTASEALRPSQLYQAPASSSFFIKGEWERPLTKHFGVRAVASYKWLGKGVTDSPLVDDDTVATWFVAGVYHF